MSIYLSRSIYLRVSLPLLPRFKYPCICLQISECICVSLYLSRSLYIYACTHVYVCVYLCISRYLKHADEDSRKRFCRDGRLLCLALPLRRRSKLSRYQVCLQAGDKKRQEQGQLVLMTFSLLSSKASSRPPSTSAKASRGVETLFSWKSFRSLESENTRFFS